VAAAAMALPYVSSRRPQPSMQIKHAFFTIVAVFWLTPAKHAQGTNMECPESAQRAQRLIALSLPSTSALLCVPVQPSTHTGVPLLPLLRESTTIASQRAIAFGNRWDITVGPPSSIVSG
jgi:hypothetical protein